MDNARMGRKNEPYYCHQCKAWHLTSRRDNLRVKIEELENQVAGLLRDNAKLLNMVEAGKRVMEENATLRDELKNAKKETTKQINADKRIQKLNDSIAKLSKTNTRLTLESNELIAKLMACEKLVNKPIADWRIISNNINELARQMYSAGQANGEYTDFYHVYNPIKTEDEFNTFVNSQHQVI